MLDAELTRPLKELAPAEGATLFMTLLAAFQVLLYRYSGQEDVVVGRRSRAGLRPELEGLIGFFVNTLVLRGTCRAIRASGSSWDGCGAALEAYAHQDLPFERLVEELHPKRDLSRNPLIQVTLAMQNTPPGELRLEGLEVEVLTDRDLANESAKFDLHFSVTEVDGVLRTRVEYALDLFDAGTIERMVGHWRVLLEGIVSDPAQSISRLPLLTRAEREQLAAGCNAVAGDACAHELFERQAAHRPQAMAVTIGEQSLSYAELNARANRLAHHLALPKLPLTAHGKIDRLRLPKPDEQALAFDPQGYAAPRDDTERLLCRIWAETLGVSRVGLDDNFFDVGGHSLLGAKLSVRLSEEFGQTLPLATLLKAPTVRALAEYLRSSAPLDGCVSLVAITRGSTRPLVFAVGGIGGSVLGFVDLARALGPEQGFYALQSVGLDGTREPIESIEAMAQLYVSEMRSVQPRGPYALIGACFGATVAHEMARRLAESGEDVALLGLLDATRHGGEEAGRPVARNPRTLSRASAAGRFVASRLRLYRRELRELGGRERIDYISGKLRTLLRRASGRASLEGVRLEMNLANVRRANKTALTRFERKPLLGRVKLLAIIETNRRAGRTSDDWAAGSGGKVVRRVVTGNDSGDMLKGGNALVLAAELAEHLKRAFEPD